MRCFKDDNCEAYEWSNSEGNETCKWWKKGGCQYETDTKDATDPNFVSCKAKGTNFNKLLNFFFNLNIHGFVIDVAYHFQSFDFFRIWIQKR